MNNTKFTPGPYTAGAKYVAQHRGPGDYYALAQAPEGKEDTEEWEHNSNLFAAAPDLYAALKECAEFLQSLIVAGLATEKTKSLTKRVLDILAEAQGGKS